MFVSKNPSSLHMYFVLCCTGYSLAFCVYREMQQAGGKTVFRTFYPRDQPGPLEGVEVIAPYPTKTLLQYKRFLAQSNGTTYAQDFPELFRQATRDAWMEAKQRDATVKIPRTLVEVTDYALGPDDQLMPVAMSPEQYVACTAYNKGNAYCFYLYHPFSSH